MQVANLTLEDKFNSVRENDLHKFGDIELLEPIIDGGAPVLAKNSFGIIKIRLNDIVYGYTPSIKSAVDKKSYFKSVIEYKYYDFFDKYELIDGYESAELKIRVEDKYGIVLMSPMSILQGHIPSLRSAINRNQYFINMCIDVHGKRYDYSKTEYKNATTKVKITCREHGDFLQFPNGHIDGAGCLECSRINGGWNRSAWVKKSEASMFFESFKLYIVRCFDEYENFYKIGITYIKLSHRFSKSSIPYNYEIIDIIKSDDGEYIWNLEKKMHKLHKQHKYIPNKKFCGSEECFSLILKGGNYHS